MTTDWQWNVINRSEDIDTSGEVTTSALRWSLTRFRYSNDAFTSSVGTTATSISAENGGVTETITRPSKTFRRSTSSGSWHSTGDLWLKQTYIKNSENVYVRQKSANTSVETKTAIINWYYGGFIGGTSYAWIRTRTTPRQAADGSFIDTSVLGTLGDVDTGVVADSSEAVSFICTTDSQSYNQVAVDWYEQTQTWIVNSVMT